jgi:SagB-type dehydrogenase family enzyme
MLSAAIQTAGKAENEVSKKAIKLPKPTIDGPVSLERAVVSRRSVRSFSEKPLTMAHVSQLLWAAQGITEPKRGLRAAPSAGACYPISLYLAVGRVEGLEPGIYLYSPSGHLLQKRASGDCRQGLSHAALGQDCVAAAPAVIGLAADHGRIRPRYGDRSVRYTDMEAGHIGQNVSLQAAALGLGTVMVGAFDDAAAKKALGLPPEEAPLYLIPVGHPAR